jgi:hypothetical protein
MVQAAACDAALLVLHQDGMLAEASHGLSVLELTCRCVLLFVCFSHNRSQLGLLSALEPFTPAMSSRSLNNTFSAQMSSPGAPVLGGGSSGSSQQAAAGC